MVRLLMAKLGRTVAMACMLGMAGCATDVTKWSDDDNSLSDADVAAAANVFGAVLASGGDAPVPPIPELAPSMAADDSCISEANQMQVASQNWGGSIQEISRRLGTAQKALFEGRCAGHPQAAAYIAGADRMLGEAEQVPAPDSQMTSNDSGPGALLNGLQQAASESAGAGVGDDCPQAASIAGRMNQRAGQLSNVVQQMEVLMWGMEELIRACPSSPERPGWESTLASAAHTCNQVATSTCQPQWH